MVGLYCYTFNLITHISRFLIAREIVLLVMYVKNFFNLAVTLTASLFNFIFGAVLLGVYIYSTFQSPKDWEKFLSGSLKSPLCECYFNLNHTFPSSIFDKFSAPGSLSALIKTLLVTRVILRQRGQEITFLREFVLIWAKYLCS